MRPHCDSCEIVVINNVVTHEIGCPKAWKDEIRKCRLCGDEFKPENKRQLRCEDCENDFYEDLAFFSILED